MHRVEVKTAIQAPIELCWELARSLKLHTLSDCFYKVNGITTPKEGLAEPGDHISWRTSYLGIPCKIVTRISEYLPYEKFTEELVSGSFESFRHEHRFKTIAGFTHITDIIEFDLGGGLFSKAMHSAVQKAIEAEVKRKGYSLKSYAEGQNWKTILGEETVI